MHGREGAKGASAVWLSSVRDPHYVPEGQATLLPLDMATKDMPNDAARLKEVIDEMQFQMDLLKGVNGALSEHIVHNHTWIKTGIRLRLTNPLDTARED